MAALDWQLKVDLRKQLRFPPEISPSPPSLLYTLRQDTVILSALIKKLSVPKANERKQSKYEDLVLLQENLQISSSEDPIVCWE